MVLVVPWWWCSGWWVHVGIYVGGQCVVVFGDWFGRGWRKHAREASRVGVACGAPCWKRGVMPVDVGEGAFMLAVTCVYTIYTEFFSLVSSAVPCTPRTVKFEM